MAIEAEITSIIAPKIEAYKDAIINFAKSRFLVAAQEFGMNEKETSALMEIADSINVEVVSDGSFVDFNIMFGTNHYLDIIQNGMPAPLSGGDGGVATNPDGSTYISNVPPILQGEPIESFAKTGKDVIGEIGTMAVNIGKDIVLDAYQASKQEIGAVARAYMIPTIQSLAGGDS